MQTRHTVKIFTIHKTSKKFCSDYTIKSFFSFFKRQQPNTKWVNDTKKAIYFEVGYMQNFSGK